MFAEKMLKIDNIHIENTMNRQCMQGVYWESSMQGERMLGIHNVRRKNAWNPQKDRKYGRNHQYTQIEQPELSIQGQRMVKINNVCRKNSQNHKYM